MLLLNFSNQQVYWYFYIMGRGKTGSAHSPPTPYKMFRCFFLSFSLLDYTTLSLYLNTNEWSIPMRVSSFQTNKFIRNCGMGKDWAGPFFPSSKIFWSFYWSVSLSVYVTLSLFFNTYEWPILKRESSFQTKHFICTATVWGGERLGRPILPPPPSKMFWSFYLSFTLSVYVNLLLYLKTYEWLISKR